MKYHIFEQIEHLYNVIIHDCEVFQSRGQVNGVFCQTS